MTQEKHVTLAVTTQAIRNLLRLILAAIVLVDVVDGKLVVYIGDECED